MVLKIGVAAVVRAAVAGKIQLAGHDVVGLFHAVVEIGDFRGKFRLQNRGVHD
jgi:hypothetical protein